MVHIISVLNSKLHKSLTIVIDLEGHACHSLFYMAYYQASYFNLILKGQVDTRLTSWFKRLKGSFLFL